MEKLNLKVSGMMTFISSGSRYQTALQFYQEIGFELDWTSDSFSVLRKDNSRFFLQHYPNGWMQDNFMMTLEVENLNDWWNKLSSLDLESKYPGVKLKPPEDYPWGKREIHLIDPCDVLWHIAVDL